MRKCILKQLIISVLLCVLFLSGGNICHSESYFCKQIGIREGLSQPGVSSIVSDSRGYLWVGTHFGLNRYRSNNVKTYLDAGYNIFTLFIDSLRQFWVASERGLFLYNQDEDSFIQVFDKTIHSVLEIDGRIYFGGSKGDIYVYEQNTKTFESNEVHVIPNGSLIVSLLDAHNGKVLIIDKMKGVFSFDRQTGNIEKIIIDNIDGKVLVTGEILYNRLYLSVYREGLLITDINGSSYSKFMNSGNSGLTFDVIMTMMLDGENLWLGTDGGGICIMDTRDGSIKETEYIPSNSFTALYKDNKGNIWTGTVRDGAFGLRETGIRTYDNLSNNAVISLWKTSDGNIWVGTDGGGVNMISGYDNSVSELTNTSKMKISSISEFDSETMILSVYTKGLFIMDKHSGALRKFVIIDKVTNDKECYSGCSPVLYKKDENTLLIFAENAYSYDINSHSFSLLSSGDIPLSNLKIFNRDENRTLYAVTDYSVIKIENTHLEELYRSHGNMMLRSAAYSGRTIWVGTDEGLFSLKDGNLDKVRTNLFTRVTQLYAQNDTTLWVAADNLLFTYNTVKGLFKVIDESDGFSPNEIVSCCISGASANSGSIFMGGTNGLVEISKNFRRASDIKDSDIMLSEVRLNGERVLIPENRHITVSQKISSFSVSVNIKGLDPLKNEMYRYIIDGNPPSVTELYSDEISYSTLPAGKHKFSVSFLKDDGSWSVPVELFEVHILAPWYLRWWFVMALFFMIAAIFAVSMLWIHYRNKSELEKRMVEQRERESEQHIKFLIDISHELRTPLTLVYSPMKRLIKEVNDEDLKETLSKIFSQVNNMKYIINSVLDKERMLVSPEALRKSAADYSEWLAETCDEFRDELAANGISLSVSSGDIGQIWFDKWKCKVVVSNILMNALKFSPAGGNVTVRACITEDGFVRTEIVDDGPGLDGISEEQLFSRFGQGNGDKIGSGIGLSFCKAIVELHGGKIGARNKESGAGAIFYFELPLTRPAEYGYSQSDISADVVVTQEPFDLSQYSLLCVEDNLTLNAMLKNELSEFKNIYTAFNGAEALESAQKNMPDIIISDIMMPVMDGFEFCRRLKSDIRTSHIPVVLLTAKADADSILNGYKLGADAYIPKPFDTELLVTVLKNILHQRMLILHKVKTSNIIVSPIESTFTQSDEQFMIKFNSYVNDKIGQPEIDIKNICEEFAMSRSLLYEKVKALTGLGVAQYIDKIKMSKASEYLLKTDKSISEIADLLGFTSSRYFSTHFKSVFNESPLAYRKQNNNHHENPHNRS